VAHVERSGADLCRRRRGARAAAAVVAGLIEVRAARGDLAIRRSIERVVFEVRTGIAHVCQQMADKCGEPPLENDECTAAGVRRRLASGCAA
jgi:hypothetical protein